MKKLYYLIILTLILGLVLTGCLLSNVGQVPATEQSELDGIIKTSGTNTGPVTLFAGQDIPVGTVTVSNDDTNLYVTYETTGDWLMTETHLAVADSLLGIPQTKKGNPKPGEFPYKHKDLGGVTNDPYVIPLGDLGADDTLYIAAHTKVIKLIGNDSTWQWATQVLGYNQGTLVCGSAINDEVRMDPNKALGVPDDEFYSLGFRDVNDTSVDNGWIELDFGYPIYNGPDPDVRTVEITWGDRSKYPREAAKVYALIDGTQTLIGTVTNHDSSDGDGSSYVSLPSGSTFIDAIKLVDDTYITDFQGESNADGFELDAVGVRYLVEAEETAWAGIVDVKTGKIEIPFPGKNWATCFTYTVQGWWDLTGTYDWRLIYTGDPVGSISPKFYDHYMEVTIHNWDTTGDFAGVGGYSDGESDSRKWVITGNVDGDDVEFYIDYDEYVYFIDATGTIATDGSMSGTCETPQGGPYDWLTISGLATRVP